MTRKILLAVAVLLTIPALHGRPTCQAGMPKILPTDWKVDTPTPSWTRQADGVSNAGARLQTLSFFVACLLLAAWGVKAIWNSLRGQFVWLPSLGYWRALGLVGLWGACFVVVLTMVSGARELMTPGAWQQQGWTYKLAESKPPDQVDRLADRRRSLEQLRFELWNYAATHAGKFPSEADPALHPRLWDIPGWPGLRYVYVANLSADSGGKLLAFEPNIDGDEGRLVLLTNGFMGMMRTSEIERSLTAEPAP